MMGAASGSSREPHPTPTQRRATGGFVRQVQLDTGADTGDGLRDHPDDPKRPRRLRLGSNPLPEDYHGLTLLTWAHVAMHGEFQLNMSNRLTLGSTPP
jgi:hypothetical protein